MSSMWPTRPRWITRIWYPPAPALISSNLFSNSSLVTSPTCSKSLRCKGRIEYFSGNADVTCGEMRSGEKSASTSGVLITPLVPLIAAIVSKSLRKGKGLNQRADLSSAFSVADMPRTGFQSSSFSVNGVATRIRFKISNRRQVKTKTDEREVQGVSEWNLRFQCNQLFLKPQRCSFVQCTSHTCTSIRSRSCSNSRVYEAYPCFLPLLGC
ncbi:hypothetical protein AC579_3798 [Pseudocercospora musae]|uniref:Uncharacterized protein n=1 Tax=Pseudocercospora musae TaxID=113226 RepID=A0A139HK15_9PEZI|nr:hypothetical protein AC579_3798 [Pseudocercospora musae]